MSADIWNNIRFGEVSAINYALARVKVTFEELDITSDWLPVVQRGAGGAKDYWLPAIGEHVVCVFYSDGTEEGVVLGSYYSADAPPPESGSGVFYTAFPDGSLVKWDNGQLTITALSGATINADVTIDGDLAVTGDINVTGDVHAANIHAGIVYYGQLIQE
ncbi:MAG: phage baseplate assembly protein V [Armatimonadota bacterium]|nr:phage baseplate assembly protein V [bacterium]